MCTVSWLLEANGYQLFFNRDEQRSRSIALPPQHHESEGTSALMPVDPDGGGSWISVNEKGLSLCLLNFYQGQLPDGVLKSRGQLLKSLSTLGSQQEISAELSAINLRQYAPFTLLAFARVASETGVINISSRGYQWDGVELIKLDICSPMTSSSVEFASVSKARKKHFKGLSENPDANHLLAFHQSHQLIKGHQLLESKPQVSSHLIQMGHHTIAGHQSVCMHRDDAKSVSLSHIKVNAEQAMFSYLDGSPCKHKLRSISALRKTANLTRLSLEPASYYKTAADIVPHERRM
ncbi:NRDE family protein [Amphritea sp. HPY]|uniref:NRDE family protein n=1 Tax=Amphritea sp. HPY TaxID=3421652 RepID=UPI003D7ED86A